MRESYESQMVNSRLQTEFKALRGMWKLKFNYLNFILLLRYKYKRFANGFLIISIKKISIFSRADKF